VAGDHVLLAVEVGDPEAVDDVGGVEEDLDGAADGDVDLVGGGEDVAGLGEELLAVLDFPPPLVADDLDGEGAGGVLDGVGGAAADKSPIMRIKRRTVVTATRPAMTRPVRRSRAGSGEVLGGSAAGGVSWPGRRRLRRAMRVTNETTRT
jgi:hypothetical protein